MTQELIIDFIINDYVVNKRSMINVKKDLKEKYNIIIGDKKISKILKENDVSIRTTKETSRKYSHNENFFENIDTEKKAYWLGFMYADGCVTGNNKSVIKLGIKDYDHLEKFKNDINATNNIKSYNGISYGTQIEYCTITLRSEKTMNDLIKQGCVKNKSLILKFPTLNQVPKHLIRHFIRGYFDGDGSVYMHTTNKTPQIEFVGTKEFLEGIILNSDLPNEYINTHIFKEKRRESNTYYIKIWKFEDVQLFYNFMYKDCTVKMDRKFNKFAFDR